MKNVIDTIAFTATMFVIENPKNNIYVINKKFLKYTVNYIMVIPPNTIIWSNVFFFFSSFLLSFNFFIHFAMKPLTRRKSALKSQFQIDTCQVNIFCFSCSHWYPHFNHAGTRSNLVFGKKYLARDREVNHTLSFFLAYFLPSDLIQKNEKRVNFY